MSTIKSSIRSAVAQFYAIAGRTLCIQPLDKGASSLVRSFVEDFYLTPRSAPPCLEDIYTIVIRAEAGLPSIPPGFETFEIELGRCYTDHEEFYFHINDSMIVANPRASHTVQVWIGETSRVSQTPLPNSILPYALEIALRQGGLYQLHSGGVIEPETGRCALIIGLSGSGKSTLTIRLASSGWRYLTDDALFLAGEEGSVRAWAVRRIFAAYERSLTSCELPGLEDALDGFMPGDPDKHRLSPGVMFPNSFTGSCVPQRLFFSSVTGEPHSHIAECSPREAMSRLIKLSAWAADYDLSMAREHLQLLGRLVKQCRSFILFSGLDILNDPTSAATLLTQYVKE